MMVIIRRILIIAIVVSGLGYGVTKFVAWRGRVLDQQHEQYLQDLNDPNPQRRLVAIEGLLEKKFTPSLGLTRAETLIELNRHATARAQLDQLISGESPDLKKIQILQLDSFLAEARIELLAIDNREPFPTLTYIEELMNGVQIQLDNIVGDNRSRLRSIYNLRRLDVLARTVQTVLATKRIELAMVEESDVNKSIQTIGIEVQDLEQKLKKTDDALIKASEQVLAKDPNNADANEILFAYALRQGELGKARRRAEQLGGLTTLDAEVACRVADTLLDIEVAHNQTLTAKEIHLADRLLTHPKLTGKKSLQFRFARIRLALEQGKPADAEYLAREYIPIAPRHPRLRCELAKAFIAQNNLDDAVLCIQQLGDINDLPECQYVFGLAMLARGGRSSALGMDALRRCVEIKPEHLPARLKLIESLVRAGFSQEAYNDIEIATRLNPNHPRVKAQIAIVSMLSEDMEKLANMVTSELKAIDSTPSAEDHQLVAAMLLDDVSTVRRLTNKRAADQPGHIFVLVGNPWLEAPANKRVPLACSVARGMLDVIDANPMMQPEAPSVPTRNALVLDPDQPKSEYFDVLNESRYVDSPAKMAVHIAERGLDAWHHNSDLIQTLVEAAIWSNDQDRAETTLRSLPPEADGQSRTLKTLRAHLNRKTTDLKHILETPVASSQEDSPTIDLIRLIHATTQQDFDTVSRTLQQLLTQHPWSEEAVLFIIRDALDRQEPDKAFSWIGKVELLNLELARLTRAKLNLALSKPAEALVEAQMMINQASPQSELRRWSAEIRAIAYAQMEQPQLAVGAFDQLQLSLKEHAIEVRIHSADVLTEMGNIGGASEILSRLLARSQNQPHLIDRMLSRAMIVMKPNAMGVLLETLLKYSPNEPILLLYQAKLTATEDTFLAEKRFKNVMIKDPGAPRALMEWANFNRVIQPDEALRVYEKLARRGGSIGASAQKKLDQMQRKTDEGTPTPKNDQNKETQPDPAKTNS